MIVSKFWFALVCVIIGYAAAPPALPALPYSTRQEVMDQNDAALKTLLENMKQFNASNLLASFRLPACVEGCVDEMGMTLNYLHIEERASIEKTRQFCQQFDRVKKCLADRPECKSMLIEIGMHAFTYLCSDDEANTGLIPCVRRETLKIHATCERACKLGATLMDAATLNTKREEVLNLLDEKGNKILSVPDLHTLCNTSTCFLSCMRTGIEQKCPNGGSAFIDNIMNSLMKEVTSNKYLPETKVLDAYASLVSSFLPRQCQHLILQEKDIILTTPGAPFSFVTPAHEMLPSTGLPTFAKPGEGVDNGIESNSVVADGEATLRDSGASKADDRKGADEQKGNGSAGSVFSIASLILMLLLTVIQL